MKCPVYIIDAFTTRRFAGNQAAVCLSHKELNSEEEQTIAAEFNLSETAFPFPREDGTNFENGQSFSLRWFTPTTEVDLCGHATLATSHVLFNEVGNKNESLHFHTRSGILTVKKRGEEVEMNFPVYDITSAHLKHLHDPHQGLFPMFNAPSFLIDLIRCVIPESVAVRSVAYAAKAKKLIVEIDEETTKFELLALSPNFSEMLSIHEDGSHVRGFIVTLSPKRPLQQGFVDVGEIPFDYVCRYFAPWVGIREDPATGSAQCALAPFWSSIKKKKDLYAYQCYPNRGAQFRVRVLEGSEEGRVSIIGASMTIVRGEMVVKNDPTFYEPPPL
ncbi:hypothetical protein PRIPAC_82665 [Pristionchus pacificus]|uniref:Uncharacterized protein n=1 Tax=Pristionchus pacificus TaxID=54126 RepID=A0A2A6BEB5_PRIPA|nr:hypothetical protein PRIPAC_82665 [Pristionchus pacificus]|eukprot:PDM64245.1 hypothetical protein PRIPAC_54489 [Pristionchus pacificus]